MKAVLLLIALLPLSLLAQLEVGSKYVYGGLGYSSLASSFGSSTNYSNFLSPTIGFLVVNEKNNLKDFQLNTFNLNNGLEITTFNVDAAYHKIFGLNKNSGSKFFLGIGVGGRVFYNFYKFRPLTSSSIPEGFNQLGLGLSIKPVVNYALSDKIYISLATILNPLNIGISTSRYDSPALPVNQRKVTTLEANTDGLYAINIDFTIAFKIN